MKAIVKNPKRLFELLRLYFVPVKGRKVVHVPAYAYKEDENEKIYLHNNELHLSKKMFEFLVNQGLDLVECLPEE
ncbi:Uncharacterised protein [Streptococcus pneumoniae]|uniref:Uncharacterized protein n=1 Tax=Streptococcus pneumoniae TaxID=1313 RepID=A0A4J1XXV9_STREE|nr:hypothetical protein [Streptococcus pneumoniae]EHD90195.1 hypothetical protein SPAR31_1384 [Streptococcus pneumoniae GA13494]EHE25197.1 hypothetical protein SPAR73_1313 [Streptococcus pneumoniae GA41565]EHE76927.1 hypothetical protein SPAR24_1291 [Streptococcus pneumoniae GA11663]EPR95691.1 hypothetical protein M057_02200 [Streptococcus pneumoniae 1779n23_04]ACB90540.1 hypothetical protein SPCG_1288 [Streptococcus pneumoniae CGSP14]